MKSYILSSNRMSYGLLFFLVGCLMFLSSCEDEELNVGPPVIERVRLTDPATADSALSKTTLGSTLVIVGKNLASTQYVMLNNYRININPVYATDRNLIITVLDSVPTVAKDPNVPNELVVVNKFGQASYQFQVLPPAPIVEQISNQFAKEGETITLYGKYFYFVQEVTFPGDVKVKDFTASADGSSLTVKIPAGFNPASGDIRVTSQSGTSNTSRTTRFYNGNKEGVVSNFDDIFPWGWGFDKDKNVTTTSPGNVIQPIDKNFALINMSLPANSLWSNDKVINIVDWGGAQTYPVAPTEKYNPSAPIANFDARMEVAAVTTSSLEGVELQVFYQNENDVELTANVPLKNFVRTIDGKWYTVSVPMASLANGTTKLSKYADLIKGNKGGQHHFRVVIINTTPNAVPVTMAIDNMRVVNAVVQ